MRGDGSRSARWAAVFMPPHPHCTAGCALPRERAPMAMAVLLHLPFTCRAPAIHLPCACLHLPCTCLHLLCASLHLPCISLHLLCTSAPYTGKSSGRRARYAAPRSSPTCGVAAASPGAHCRTISTNNLCLSHTTKGHAKSVRGGGVR